MFIGLGVMHGTEIWNNQRVLDYLAGNPDRGIPGMASAYTTVSRASVAESALALYCDRPVDLAAFSFKYRFNDLGGGVYEIGIESATLDGVALSEIQVCDNIQMGVLYEPADLGQPRPVVPGPLDPRWEVVTEVPVIPIGAYLNTAGLMAPVMSKTVIKIGGNCVATAVVYIDPSDVSVTGVTLDNGATWYNTSHTFNMVVDTGTGKRYSTPAQDDAPWYDPNVPESAEFAGLYVEEITGFDSMTNREVSESALMGGTLGPLTMKSRPLTVTGWLRASTCCGAEYGLRWLAEALAGPTACDDCAVGDLFMLKCAPPSSDPDPDPLDYVRLMHQVGLVDGPKVVDRKGTCCGSCGSTSLKVQFTLTSEWPYIFSDAEWILYNDSFPEGPFDFNLELACTKATNCPQPPPPFESACLNGFPPAPSPFLVTDRCYCEPWETMRVGTEFINPYQWNSATSYIEINAGEDRVRNLKIVAFQNPRGEECPMDYENDDRWMCVEPCASIAVSEVPPGGKLIIDSRTRRVELILAGGERVPGLQFLSSGSDGVPFEWFDIGQCTRLCLVASIEANVTDASISVGIVQRYLASGG